MKTKRVRRYASYIKFPRFSIVLVAVTGIVNTEGALWKDQRKFLHEKLRNFGMTYIGAGKKTMDSRIMVSTGFGLISL